MKNTRKVIDSSAANQSTEQEVAVWDLGRIGYRKAWDLQTKIASQLIAEKRANQGRTSVSPHVFLLCEHDPVYTLGKSGSEDNLKISALERKARQIDFFKINRGGDITFHGHGQVVGYPIFDLDRFFTDVHRYVRYLEEGIIRLLAEFDLQGRRMEGYTGVWVGAEASGYRKICAIGVHLSRWVTMHGFALNLETDLDYFGHIIPCGISDPDKGVTSLALELNGKVDPAYVKNRLVDIYSDLFGFSYRLIDKDEMYTYGA